MRKVYQIDENGLYVTDVLLDNNDQTPSDCVDVDPPQDGSIHVFKWDGTQWVEGKSADELLAAYKSSTLANLQNARDVAVYSTFQSSALGSPKTYAYDPISKDRLLGQLAILTATTSITTVKWVNDEDGLVAHTRDQFIQVVNDAYNHESVQAYKYIQAEPKINAATSTDEVDSIMAGIVW